MENGSFQFVDGKVIIHTRDRLCDTPDQLLSSDLFQVFLKRCIANLLRKESKLLGIFSHLPPAEDEIHKLITNFKFLVKLPADLAIKVVDGSEYFYTDRALFNDFVEYLYNAWRSLQRFVICNSEGDRYDNRPYHTFNNTVETLTHLVRSTYRDIQENITGDHPRIYRQVRAGAEVAAIALPKGIAYPNSTYAKLNQIAVIRQVLIYPPLIFTPPMNKRTGIFERVYQNPLETIDIRKEDWLCYPARVGPLLIMVYFSQRFFELGFAMCNLFEMANDEDIKRKPDAIFLFGVPEAASLPPSDTQTIFYDDEQNDMLVGAIPERDQFGYFGYLKKMVLTLHNIKIMKMGRLPFHGALVNISIRGKGSSTLLIMGDTGAGKSETLEALRMLEDQVQDITTIADDMGSVELGPAGEILGFGTETGAFVRLDDLQPGFAFGQIDRTIIMSPNQVNARVIIPVTTYANVVKGYPIDYVLYANNYEEVDVDHPLLQRFGSAAEALPVFRAGAVMSKGTTTSTGIVGTYFANIFGPQQYQQLHEGLAEKSFAHFFQKGLFVGQLRTQLGIPGKERSGPAQAAAELLSKLQS
jgi:hypothetical protein